MATKLITMKDKDGNELLSNTIISKISNGNGGTFEGDVRKPFYNLITKLTSDNTSITTSVPINYTTAVSTGSTPLSFLYAYSLGMVARTGTAGGEDYDSLELAKTTYDFNEEKKTFTGSDDIYYIQSQLFQHFITLTDGTDIIRFTIISRESETYSSYTELHEPLKYTGVIASGCLGNSEDTHGIPTYVEYTGTAFLVHYVLFSSLDSDTQNTIDPESNNYELSDIVRAL